MEKMKIENMELYTVSECAELLKCSGKTIQRLIEKKKLQAFDIGAGQRKVYRIPVEELERFVEETATNK